MTAARCAETRGLCQAPVEALLRSSPCWKIGQRVVVGLMLLLGGDRRAPIHGVHGQQQEAGSQAAIGDDDDDRRQSEQHAVRDRLFRNTIDLTIPTIGLLVINTMASPTMALFTRKYVAPETTMAASPFASSAAEVPNSSRPWIETKTNVAAPIDPVLGDVEDHLDQVLLRQKVADEVTPPLGLPVPAPDRMRGTART